MHFHDIIEDDSTFYFSDGWFDSFLFGCFGVGIEFLHGSDGDKGLSSIFGGGRVALALFWRDYPWTDGDFLLHSQLHPRQYSYY